jgi:hypothetical protein
MIDVAPDGTCGACSAFKAGFCTERNFTVGKLDPGCPMFDPARAEG